MPVFFVAWVGIGAWLGLGLARRGHDRRTMLALGAGLGPLMLVGFEAIRRRERLSQPLVVEDGIDHGGDLDVVVFAGGSPRDVESATENLNAVRPKVGRVSLVALVDFESLEDGRDDIVVRAASAELAAARELLAMVHPALVVAAGDPERVVHDLVRPGRRALVLHAVGAPSGDGDPGSHGR